MNYTKRIYYKIINPPRTLYRFIFRPKTFGVKALIKSNGKYLMIRNSYGKMHWTFPGGGMKKNELAEEAAKRETFEEVGIKLEKLEYFGFKENNRHFKRDTVYFFKADVNDVTVKIDPNEVKEYNWFSRDNFPDQQSKIVNEMFELLKKDE